jgi:hypothetical protein
MLRRRKQSNLAAAASLAARGPTSVFDLKTSTWDIALGTSHGSPWACALVAGREAIVALAVAFIDQLQCDLSRLDTALERERYIGGAEDSATMDFQLGFFITVSTWAGLFA